MSDVLDAAAPGEVPSVTGTGNERTPSTPGRKPGQKNGTGRAASGAKRPPAAAKVPGASRPPAPKARGKDYRETIAKTVTKVGGSLMAAGAARNAPVLVADGIAVIERKEELADALNALAQDNAWLAKALEKAAVIAPGAELAAALVGIGTQVAVNHGAIPLEMGKLMDAKDPRELLAANGFAVQDAPVEQAA